MIAIITQHQMCGQDANKHEAKLNAILASQLHTSYCIAYIAEKFARKHV